MQFDGHEKGKKRYAHAANAAQKNMMSIQVAVIFFF